MMVLIFKVEKMDDTTSLRELSLSILISPAKPNSFLIPSSSVIWIGKKVRLCSVNTRKRYDELKSCVALNHDIGAIRSFVDNDRMYYPSVFTNRLS